MSDSLVAELPQGTGVVRVGTNGAHQIMLALWFAAYALAGRPDSRRVVNWVDNRWPGLGNRKFHPAAPDVLPRSPATLRALVAFSYEFEGDACSAIVPQEPTIRRGRMLRPPADPMLSDLLALWDYLMRHPHTRHPLELALTARLAGHMEALLPHLSASCWYGKMAAVAGLFAAARSAGVAVRD